MHQTAIAIHKPSENKPLCDFVPRKSLEEVLDDLKGGVSFFPTHDPIRVVPSELVVKKKGRYAKQNNLDVNLISKRSSRFISRKLRNR